MGVGDVLEIVLGTLTERELAVFQARAEKLTYPIIAKMLETTPNAALRAHQRAQLKIGRAFLPLAYAEIRSGACDSANLNLPKPRSSRFRGVYWSGNKQKWEARVYSTGERKKYFYVGQFDNELDAARAYDAEAMRLNGPTAVTNESLGLFENAA